jgi:hypothetical protein
MADGEAGLAGADDENLEGSGFPGPFLGEIHENRSFLDERPGHVSAQRSHVSSSYASLWTGET